MGSSLVKEPRRLTARALIPPGLRPPGYSMVIVCFSFFFSIEIENMIVASVFYTMAVNRAR